MWLCKHTETGFSLAVKVRKKKKFQTGKKKKFFFQQTVEVVNETLRSSLEKEIEVLKKCKSPNILSYFGTCTLGNQVWVKKKKKILFKKKIDF